PKKLMVRDVLLELDKMLRRLIGEDITINTSFAGKLTPILADPGQMDQLIVNLVVNAVDAIRDNDVGKPRVITISSSQVYLDNIFTSTHTGSTAGTCLLLEIADTGSGMSKETSDHIFEPFYTTKEQGKGTGLGLATVYGIVKQNHGYITVDSTPGEGTSFKIYWPVIEDIAEGKQEEEKEEESREPQVPGGTETILLVEDDEILRNITCHHLRHRGYNVIEAENGVDALEKASSAAVDLLFTDMVMPVMNGWELGEKIKSIHPDIEILYTSGYFDDRWKNGNISPPEERFIDKPYDPREVLVWIRKLLGGRS
ncbi:MAG: ATP-binding protein, partial [Pseudomonadota bacterium]|nr:ATP-binding protein [Pseudomonadota bacterium]